MSSSQPAPKRSKWAPDFERYVAFASDRAGLLMIGFLVLSALAALSASGIQVDTRIEALLPPESESLNSLEELNRRAASSSTLRVYAVSPDVRVNRDFAQRVEQRLAEWEDVESVVSVRDVSFFSRNRLLFLQQDSLTDAVDDIEARVEWEQCNAIPGCVNFDDQTPWPDAEELVAEVRERPEYRAIPALDPPGEQRETAGEEDGSNGARAGELCARDGSFCAVEAVMTGDAGDLLYARDVYARARRVLDEMQATGPEDLRLLVVGRYRTGPIEYDYAVRDLAWVGVISTSLIFLFAWLQFRRVRAVLMLGIPLAMGLLWTLGLIGMIDPQLNIISAFTLAILAGLGIDFGLHLLTHYGSARDEGQGPSEALRHTLQDLSGTMAAAGITTGAAFVALTASDFHGFAQMGRLAGLGVFCCLLAYVFVFPVWVLWLDRRIPESGSVLRGHRSVLLRLSGVSRRALMGLVFVVVVAGFVTLPEIAFEHNFRNLRPPEISHGIPARGAFNGARGVPVYLLADDPESLEAAAADLRTREGWGRDGAAPLVVTARTFIPGEQEPKLEELERLREALEDMREPDDEDDARRLAELREWASPDTPIDADSLPSWARTWLEERDGSFGRLGIAYNTRSGADAIAMEALSNELVEWRAAHPGVLMASSQALLGRSYRRFVQTHPGFWAWLYGPLSRDWGLARSWRVIDVSSALLFLLALPRRGSFFRHRLRTTCSFCHWHSGLAWTVRFTWFGLGEDRMMRSRETGPCV